MNLICKQLACDLTDSDIEEIAELTDGIDCQFKLKKNSFIF